MKIELLLKICVTLKFKFKGEEMTIIKNYMTKFE